MNNPGRTVKIGLVPRLHGLGGMVSFESRLASGLEKRGIQVTYNITDPACRGILVIGGTRLLGELWDASRNGARIVQRLDGMNWLHRKQRTGVRHYLRSEANNMLLTLIRRFVADAIVYQSRFSQTWWERMHGTLTTPCDVIYNGVDLGYYSPVGPERPPEGCYRILLVEGHMNKDNAQGLENAIGFVSLLREVHHLPVELVVAGDVSRSLQTAAQAKAPGLVSFLGVLPREQIPGADRSSHLVFSADLNAACPNVVIEALACGLPVLAYDTGALAELVSNGAGKVVPYGSNHWNLEPPSLPPLAQAAADILADNERYRKAARLRAEAVFGVDEMVDRYLQVLMK